MRVTRAARPSIEIELEIAVSLADAGNGVERGRGQRRTSEIRVEYDSSCIDHATQRWSPDERDPRCDRTRPGGFICGQRDGVFARATHDFTDRRDDETAWSRLEQCADPRALEKCADARQGAARITHHGGGVPGRAGGRAAGTESFAVLGGGGLGVVNRRSLGCTRPLNARIPVALNRYSALGLSGAPSFSVTSENGGGSAGLGGGGGGA